jgi:hypothetical protein
MRLVAGRQIEFNHQKPGIRRHRAIAVFQYSQTLLVAPIVENAL